MEKKFIKNIEVSKTLELANLVDYQPGKVVSLTFAQNEALSLTLFAFAQGEGVSTHSAPGDAMVYILDGEAEVTIGSDKMIAKQGEVVVMPANIPHGLEAVKNFKMLLTVVFK
jgi:quercetin dioxygenase-like cupin family protein